MNDHAGRPSRDHGMLEVVRAALQGHPRRLPSKYFYDQRGSELFERICALPEYYLTRAELALMQEHADPIAALLGRDVLLMEYGSGSGLKTELLLKRLQQPVAYMPVEISRAALAASVAHLHERFPELEILPVCADFTAPFTAPVPMRAPRRRVVYFPGSTIGNFERDAAVQLLRLMRTRMAADDAALIGVDLVKDPAIIEAAYNDAAGITAQFTLNMLARLNRDIGTDFDLEAFRHQAAWNPDAERIETHVLSTREQDVHLDGQAFHFARDEAMLVEYSCKYSLASFARLARDAGLRVDRVWTDPAQQFSVQYLMPADAG